MSLESFKSSQNELISSWLLKYNRLVGKVIYDIRVVEDELWFMTTDSPEPMKKVKLPHLGDGLGEAEATDYPTNYFIKDGQTHAIAISSLDAILHALAPPTAESLNGKKLVVNFPLYSAKLAKEAAAGWSASGTVAPGQTFTGVIMSNTYTLTTPDPATTFEVGRKDEPIGELAHIVNGNQINRMVMSAAPTTHYQNASTMTVESEPYNLIWQKGNAQVEYVQGGVYAKHVLRHLDNLEELYGGETDGLELWYDNLDISQVSINAPLVTDATPLIKMLSGIGYYGKNSTLNVTYNVTNLFRNCYHPTAVSTISSGAFEDVISNPVYVPRSSDIFYVNKTVHLDKAFSSGANLGTVTATATRPDGRTKSVTMTLGKRICAYGNVATPLEEYFLDEYYRVVADSTITFNSAVLQNGEAQVRNGVLVYGNADFPAKTGTQQYQRFILNNPASNGAVSLGSIDRSQLSPYGTGDLNLLLKLESGTYFDLAISFGMGGDGATPATAKGGRVDELCTASTTAFSFGEQSTSDSGNGGKYRLILRLRDTTIGKAVQVSNIITT